MKIEKHYKIGQVAKMSGISEKTIRDTIIFGGLRAIQSNGKSGIYLIPESEVNRYLKSLEYNPD